MTSDVTSAPRKLLTSTCGTIQAAMKRDAAATSHDTSSLSGFSFGRTSRSSGAMERILTVLVARSAVISDQGASGMASVGLNAIAFAKPVERCMAGEPTAEHSIGLTFKMAIRVQRHAEIRGPVRYP